jgi:O-methyltransferase
MLANLCCGKNLTIYLSHGIVANMTLELYLDLLKGCLTRSIWQDNQRVLEPTAPRPFWKQILARPLLELLQGRDLFLVKRLPYPKDKMFDGRAAPEHAETMIGWARLNNIQECAIQALKENIPGDFVETGVWRGGASIFMKGVLRAMNDTERNLWVADSFEGLPAPDAKYPADAKSRLHLMPYLAVSLEQVRANFERYGLLDDRVKFLKGWFKDTLPTAPIGKISVLRLDGDLYESTMDSLANLYDKVSSGGFIIVDDYGAIDGCRRAIHDFRTEKNITEPLQKADWSCVYWRKR